MRASFLASLTISTLFCLVTAPAWAQEAPASVPPSSMAPVVTAPSSVPVIHAPAAATASDSPELVAPKRRWYGWQTLTTDAASLTLIATGVSTHHDALAFTGIASLAAMPPIIHLAHGNYGYAGVSFATRVVGVPLGGGVGYVLGGAVCSRESRETDVDCAAIAANLSMIGAAAFAIALDSGILGYDSGSNDEDTVASRPRRQAALRVMPSLSLSRERSLITLSGDF